MYSNQSINQSINQSKRILVFQKGRTVINLRIRRTFTLDRHQCHIHSLINHLPPTYTAHTYRLFVYIDCCIATNANCYSNMYVVSKNKS